MRATFTKSPDSRTLIDEWTRLYAQSEARFFLSPVWIEAWINSVPSGVEIGCVRIFDDLRGVYGLGLIGVPRRRISFAAPREARLHETGVEESDRLYIEYNDILMAADAPFGARETAIAAVIDGLAKIDEFVFRNAVPVFAPAAIGVAKERKFAARSINPQPTYQINLQAPGRRSIVEEFSPSLRAKIRRSIRRYEERGTVKLQRAHTEGERTIAWTSLMRLHAETWSRRGLGGAFCSARFSEFHGRFVESHPASTDLVRLSAGGETIGVLYNFIDGDRIYNYQSGFRYETDNQLTPGYVCHALAAERYRDDGFLVYDMMGGDAEYKRRLGNEGDALQTVILARPNIRNAARALGGAIGLTAEGMRRT